MYVVMIRWGKRILVENCLGTVDHAEFRKVFFNLKCAIWYEIITEK